MTNSDGQSAGRAYFAGCSTGGQNALMEAQRFPLCGFPDVAKYNGSGSTSMAANFTCVRGEPEYNQMPAPQYGP